VGRRELRSLVPPYAVGCGLNELVVDGDLAKAKPSP